MIAIIDGCGSNIASLQYALERIKVKSIVTVDPTKIETASHVILPGVGHAGHAMQRLKENNLLDLVRHLTQPVLGICLGMQLLYEKSEEGNTECLGIIPGKIKKIPSNVALTVPHMGWNILQLKKNSTLLSNVNAQPYVYFVHRFYAPIDPWTIAATQHGIDFASIVKYKNFSGMQFHPEKSAGIGEQLLINFVGST